MLRKKMPSRLVIHGVSAVAELKLVILSSLTAAAPRVIHGVSAVAELKPQPTTPSRTR